MFCWKTVPITPVSHESLYSRLLKVADSLYILLLVFFKLAADNAVILVEEDLRLDRFCQHNENFSAEECQDMKETNLSYVMDEIMVQEDEFKAKADIICIPISLFVVTFTASWTDRHGRKPLLKLSIIGYFLYALIYIIFAALEDWPVEVLISAYILRSLGGGPSLFVMSVFSMMVDKNKYKNRNIWMGSLTNMIIIGEATGYVAGLIIRGWGASPIWIIFVSLLLYVIATLIITILLNEDSADFEVQEFPRWSNSCIDLLHPKNVCIFFCVTTRRRPHRDRLHLLLILLVTFFVLFSPPYRIKEWTTTSLQWTAINYSIVSSASVFCCQVVTMVFLRMERKRNVNECLFAAIAEAMTAIQDALLSFITRPELSGIIYASMLFSVTHNLSNVGIRITLSKICEHQEIGRVFGIMALQETFMSWAHDLLYDRVYEATRESLPTFQHALSTIFAVLNASILLAVFVSSKHVHNNRETTEEEAIVTKPSSCMKNENYQSTENKVIDKREEIDNSGIDNFALDADSGKI